MYLRSWKIATRLPPGFRSPRANQSILHHRICSVSSEIRLINSNGPISNSHSPNSISTFPAATWEFYPSLIHPYFPRIERSLRSSFLRFNNVKRLVPHCNRVIGRHQLGCRKENRGDILECLQMGDRLETRIEILHLLMAEKKGFSPDDSPSHSQFHSTNQLLFKLQKFSVPSYAGGTYPPAPCLRLPFLPSKTDAAFPEFPTERPEQPPEKSALTPP